MKTPLILLVAIVAMSSIFTSCQKEELASPNNSEKETYLKAPTATGAKWYHTSGTCSGDDLTMQFCVDGEPNCGKVQIQQLIGGIWVQVVGPTTPTDGCVSYTIASAESGHYEFRAQWNSSGSGCSGAGTGWVLVGISLAPCGCEDSFTAACSSGGCGTYTVTYTFIAEEAGPIVIQGGLSSGAEICSADGGVLTQNTTHPSVINSKASVTRWEGDVEACVPVTVTISYNGGSATTGEWSAQRNEVVLGGYQSASCPN